MGGRRDEHAGREERRHGVGEDDLGDVAVGFEVGERRSSSQLRLRPSPCRSRNGFAVRAAPGVELVAYVDSRYSRYASIDPPAWQSAEITM